MPEKIESILREIHLLLSKGEMYNENPDKVIISKRQMFDMLEHLNYAVVEVMDHYEATTRSKERAKKEVEAYGQKIIDAANKEAEDVYAASMLYTDGALNELYAEITDARANLRNEYEKFEMEIAERLEVIRGNQNELMEQLRALSQGRKYFDLIEDYNRQLEEEEELEREKAAKAAELEFPDDEDEDEEEEKPAKSGKKTPTAVIPERFRKQDKKRVKSNENGEKEYGLQTIGRIPDEDEAAKSEKKADKKPKRNLLPADEEEIEWPDDPAIDTKVEVKVHTGGGLPENSIYNTNVLKSKKERDRAAKETKKKKGLAETYPELAAALDAADEEAAAFSSEALDAEYEQWQNGTDAESADTGKTKGKNIAAALFDRILGK